MILKSVLLNIINAQKRLFFNRKYGIERALNLDFDEQNKELIVINGIKRTGKSTFLFQLYKQHFSDVFYVNFEHPGLYDFDKNDFFKLDELINNTGNQVLFFDEITELQGWQTYVGQKLDEGFKVIVTASNAEIFTNDSSTLLIGRYITKTLLPFSFDEFCTYYSSEKDEDAVLAYMQQGGFPANQHSKNTEYLTQLFDDIVVREIALRYGVRDMRTFKRLAIHLLNNIGSLVTGNQLKNTIGIKTTSTAVDYLSYLEAGFLMHYVPKFSFSTRKQMINPRKVYVVDLGFVAASTFNIHDKVEVLLENLVFLKLRRSQAELYYFKENYNCDFIVFGKDKALKAVQVCAHLQPDNLELELNGLFEAMDYFQFSESNLVTMNQTDRFERDGKIIDVVPFYKF